MKLSIAIPIMVLLFLAGCTSTHPQKIYWDQHPPTLFLQVKNALLAGDAVPDKELNTAAKYANAHPGKEGAYFVVAHYLVKTIPQNPSAYSQLEDLIIDLSAYSTAPIEYQALSIACSAVETNRFCQL